MAALAASPASLPVAIHDLSYIPFLFLTFFVGFPILIGLIVGSYRRERRAASAGVAPGWPLLILWVALNTIGFPAAGLVNLPLLFLGVLPGGAGGSVIMGMVSGVEVGVLQWVALRQRMPGAVAWILATAVGFAVGAGLGLSLGMGGEAGFSVGLGAGSPDPWTIAVRYGLVGGAIGAVQCLVLWRISTVAPWWAIASALGFGLGFAADQTLNLGLLQGAIIGSITGVALVIIMRGAVSWPILSAAGGVAVLALLSMARLFEPMPPPVVRPYLYYIGFSPTTPPADNLACREAVAYAIDRDFVERQVGPWTEWATQAAYSIEHPRAPSSNNQQTSYRLDRTKAVERFRACSWDKPFTILAEELGPPPSPRWVHEYYVALERTLRESIPTATVLETAQHDELVAQAQSGQAAAYLVTWITDPADFGYPSTALGIADWFVRSPEIMALRQARDGRAVERRLLDEVLVIPILHTDR